MKQIKFRDEDDVFGGILTDEGNIICGCCGGVIPSDEIDGRSIEIVKIYKDWINISQEIIGE